VVRLLTLEPIHLLIVARTDARRAGSGRGVPACACLRDAGADVTFVEAPSLRTRSPSSRRSPAQVLNIVAAAHTPARPRRMRNSDSRSRCMPIFPGRQHAAVRSCSTSYGRRSGCDSPVGDVEERQAAVLNRSSMSSAIGTRRPFAETPSA